MASGASHVAYRLQTRSRPGLLFAMMHGLASDDARISFEGSLSNTDLAKTDGVSFAETEVLRRATLSPPLDFMVLPLTPATVAIIKKAIVSKIGFKHYRGIVHVQIERSGAMAFAAYDHFHKDCVVAYSAVPVGLLMDLVERKVLYSFEAIAAGSKVT